MRMSLLVGVSGESRHKGLTFAKEVTVFMVTPY